MPPINQPPAPAQPPTMPGDIQVIENTLATPVAAPAIQPQAQAKTEQATDNKKPHNPNSTQNTLLLSEVRDGLVIMADGSYRAVLACQSINFDLMSAKEKDGVEFSYQNFLNSLNFPIQIFIRSQKVDIEPYLDHLDDLRKAQDNMLLGVLMDDYIDFIDSVSREANIMDKSFYIAIPYYPEGISDNIIEQSKSMFSKLLPKAKNKVTKISKESYEKAKEVIANRVDSVASGLYQIGINSVQLGTKELGELYYNVYNPDTAVRQPLFNFENVTSTYTKKKIEPVATAPSEPAKPVSFGSSS